MKYLKLFEEFNGFIELTYDYYNDDVRVQVVNNEVIDIYTNKNNYIDLVKWNKGDNSLFVHCDKNDWYIMLDELLNDEDSTLLNEYDLDDNDEPLEDEQFYLDLEDKMRKQQEILSDANKYNL